MTVVMERPGRYVRTGGGDLPPLRRFAVVVDRVPDAAQARVIGQVATVLWDPGLASVRLWFEWPAPTVAEAIVGAVRLLEQAGLRALRVDAGDWVTAGDIAERIGRSRETVRLWATGRFGPGGFPPPLNPGRGTSFYSWAEVVPWLRAELDLDLPYEEPVLAAANLTLQLRRLLPRVSGARMLLDLMVR